MDQFGNGDGAAEFIDYLRGGLCMRGRTHLAHETDVFLYLSGILWSLAEFRFYTGRPDWIRLHSGDGFDYEIRIRLKLHFFSEQIHDNLGCFACTVVVGFDT